MEDIDIEHTTETNVKFREKIPLDFFNVFQSYTNLNMFNGMKDFFNLERVVFYDDDTSSADSQNMFVSEKEKKVFFKEPSEITLKYFPPMQRARIMEEINNETFNFFLYSADDEYKTESIVGMFMPEMSNITQVLLIIKPEYSKLIDAIVSML